MNKPTISGNLAAIPMPAVSDATQHAHMSRPDLLAEVQRLTAERDALRAALERARNHLIMDIDRDGNGIHSTDTPDALRQARAALERPAP